MLTKDLLNFSRRNGKIYPRFADAADADAMDRALQLSALFASAAEDHLDRGTLEEMLAMMPPPVRRCAKLHGGLIKLLTDDSEFALPQERDHLSYRRQVLECASALLAEAAGDIDYYRSECSARCGVDFVPGRDDLYGDLPDHEVLLRSRHRWSAEELINRYNVSLVQSLAVYAGKLNVSFAAVESSAMRRFLRVVRFHRLLAAGKRDEKSGICTLEISGPFAIFGAARKYALQLASFLPAVLLLPEWKLAAELDLPSGPGRLELDHRCGLIPLDRDLGGYVPEEIRLFSSEFKKRTDGWVQVADAPLLPAGDSGFSVPDFSFRRVKDDLTVHLELFHRWHRGGLPARINYLREHPEMPLVLGVDRALCSEEDLLELCGGDGAVRRKILLFRDFPGAESVRRLLDSAVL